MTDKTRFDPLGWLVSACLAVLVGAVALTVAVRLIRSIWPWLLGIVLVGAGIALLISLLVGWRRRQW